ncbi:MFS transporter [Myxozyma melibiosi]|uniref:MFS transporter n=1 Tax=Myxozyma melibiosi TaxID=54550 RepID=A0ABR1FFR2_9ASCO
MANEDAHTLLDASAQNPPPQSSKLRMLMCEVGLQALLESSTDVRILCFQRLVRMIAYGQATLILTLYFSALGFSDERIGLFMSATLIGDVLISFFLTLFADALGRRRVLILGCAMMFTSGLIFAIFDNFWILLIAAIVGVISPNGNEVGPFRAVEESTLAHLVSAESRTDIFSWYALLGRIGSGLGTISCGTLVQVLQDRAGWSNVYAYRFIYVSYSSIALIKLYSSFKISDKCELPAFLERRKKRAEALDESLDENAIMLENMQSSEDELRDGAVQEEDGRLMRITRKSGLRSSIPSFSARSKKTLSILMPLFFLDSFGQGLVNNSWLTYYFNDKFGVKEASLGGIFLTGHIVATFGALIAASTAKRLGVVQTMIITHIPSSIILGLIPASSNLFLAIFLFAVRAGTNMMDTAPRQVFVSSIVLAEERTSVMGIMNVVRTLSTAFGPAITGAFAGQGRMWISFEIAMAMKLLYDVGILSYFLKEKLDRS